jgi:putative phosphoribosyl transferase
VRFADRADAGRKLAQRLAHLQGQDVVVLGLPRGGVPVALQVAETLGAPLDVIVVRKLGIPFQPELAMGAIGEDGVRVINAGVVTMAGARLEEMAIVEKRERAELERRARRFRRDGARIPLAGRTVIIVDDGIATGSTARAACQVARAEGARRIVLAVPVAPPGWTKRIHRDADEFVALETPEPFFAVGQFYADFSPTTDEEVSACLERAATGHAESATVHDTAFDDPPGRDEEVSLAVGPVQLAGHLTVPERATGIVVFVHGSGSSRHSSRNRFVAAVLNDAGLGTLLFDLLTADEALERDKVFDIDLLAGRLLHVTRWLTAQPEARSARIGYFGASTGAAAALWAAAEPGTQIAAVVSRGGRPDLAARRLECRHRPDPPYRGRRRRRCHRSQPSGAIPLAVCQPSCRCP